MTGLWQLPAEVDLGGQIFGIRADYREILRVIACLEDPALPEQVRWLVALELFYREPVPRQLRREAMEYLAYFLTCGAEAAPGPKLLDWQQDADAIIAGVNQAAGQEIRALPFLHWWTFLGWFHTIGEGQLSTRVAIRDRLARGKPLEPWQKEFYRENKHRVELRERLSPAQQAEKVRLEQLLRGEKP